MSEPNIAPESKQEGESNTEWVKQRISDEEITKMQGEMKEMQTRLDNSVKMLHQRDMVIKNMSRLLESYGINMIVLARNSQGLIDQTTEFE